MSPGYPTGTQGSSARADAEFDGGLVRTQRESAFTLNGFAIRKRARLKLPQHYPSGGAAVDPEGS
jgi:hypothetical protein